MVAGTKMESKVERQLPVTLAVEEPDEFAFAPLATSF